MQLLNGTKKVIQKLIKYQICFIKLQDMGWKERTVVEGKSAEVLVIAVYHY